MLFSFLHGHFLHCKIFQSREGIALQSDSLSWNLVCFQPFLPIVQFTVSLKILKEEKENAASLSKHCELSELWLGKKRIIIITHQNSQVNEVTSNIGTASYSQVKAAKLYLIYKALISLNSMETNLTISWNLQWSFYPCDCDSH